MMLLGDANWWLPGWLDRRLPTMQFESGDEVADVEREPVGVS
jgi:RND superfamily putative drug exporter